MTKKCNKCGQVKSFSEFFKDKANKTDGLYGMCKECKTAATLKWRAENKEIYNTAQRAYSGKHRTRIHYKRAYGITPEVFDQMLVEQGNRCKICQRKYIAKTKKFVIDHCHDSGKLRGILCYNCNRGMHYVDDAKFMAAALEYKNS